MLGILSCGAFAEYPGERLHVYERPMDISCTLMSSFAGGLAIAGWMVSEIMQEIESRKGNFLRLCKCVLDSDSLILFVRQKVARPVKPKARILIMPRTWGLILTSGSLHLSATVLAAESDLAAYGATTGLNRRALGAEIAIETNEPERPRQG